jgi:hypothetical protein
MTLVTRAAAAFACGAALAACSDSTANSGPPASITKVSGDNQSGVVSTALAQPFVVKVADTAGVGVSNVAIVWTLTVGSGTLTVAKATTDGSGKAQASLAIGTGAGTRIVTVAASAITTGTNSATFVAIAAAPETRDDWITYGHDGHRTSASQASLNGPLTVSWRYAPPSPVTNPYTVVFDALAAADGVYLQWGSTGTFFGFGTGTNVSRVSPAGAKVWANTSWGADYNIGHWGSIYGTKFVYQDDGLGYLDLATGARPFNTSVDWWGETLPDSTGLYVSQNWHVDGPQTFVGSLSATGSSRWKTNLYGAAKADIGVWDPSGGLALNNGVLFFDPVYSGSLVPPNPKGVFAFTASSGALVKFVATTPNSHISADATKVYLVETGATTLVARAQSDLHVVWTYTIPYAGPQAPLLANNLVIVGTSTDVEAFDAATGARVWRSAPLSGLTTYSSGSTTTYLAAALGSGTLICTTSTGIHILSLLNGTELWKGATAGASGTPHDPVIVNDPVNGPVLYVVDGTGVIALKGAP